MVSVLITIGQEKNRPEIEAGLSYGRLFAMMSHMNVAYLTPLEDSTLLVVWLLKIILLALNWGTVS